MQFRLAMVDDTTVDAIKLLLKLRLGAGLDPTSIVIKPVLERVVLTYRIVPPEPKTPEAVPVEPSTPGDKGV